MGIEILGGGLCCPFILFPFSALSFAPTTLIVGVVEAGTKDPEDLRDPAPEMTARLRLGNVGSNCALGINVTAL